MMYLLFQLCAETTGIREVTDDGEDLHICRDGGSDVCRNHEWWSRLSLDGRTSRKQDRADKTWQASHEDETGSASRAWGKESCYSVIQYLIHFSRISVGRDELTSNLVDAVRLECEDTAVRWQWCGWSVNPINRLCIQFCKEGVLITLSSDATTFHCVYRTRTSGTWLSNILVLFI